jgi:hypothetical protein
MAETAKTKGPSRRYADDIYLRAHELYREQRMTAAQVAAALEEENPGERFDGTQIQALDKIGAKIKSEARD